MKRLLAGLLLAFAPLLAWRTTEAQAQGFGIGGGLSGTGAGTGTVTTTGCTVARSMPVMNGVSGTELICTPNTIQTDGSNSLTWTATPSAGAADAAIYRLASSDSGTEGVPIVYAIGQHYYRGFYYTPSYFVSGASNPAMIDVGFQIDGTVGGGDHDDIWGFNFIGQNSSATYKAGRSLLPFSSMISFENATTQPLVASYFSHFDNLSGVGTGTVTRLAGFVMDDTAPGFIGGTWATGMTITNAYGILIEDQQLAGMNAAKWNAATFGGNVGLEDNGSSASATVDNVGWLFWGPLQTDSYAQRSYGFRWNADNARAETSFGTTNVNYGTYSGNIVKDVLVVDNDKRSFCTNSTVGVSGNVCLDIDPGTVDGVSITAAGSSGAQFNVQGSTTTGRPNKFTVDANDATQDTPTGTANQVTIADLDSSTTDSYKFFRGTSGPYVNINTIVEHEIFSAAVCTSGTVGTTFLNLPTTNAPAPGCTASATDGTTPLRGTLAFSGTASNIAYAFTRLPSDWVAPIDVVLHTHIVASNSVTFGISTGCYSTGESVSPALNTEQQITATTVGGTVDELWTFNSVSVSGTSTCAAGDMLILKIRRDGGVDSGNSNMFLTTVDITTRRDY